MEPNLAQERQQAHALLDLLPPAKLGAVRSFLEDMLDEDDDELPEKELAAIQVGIDSLEKHGPISMEDVLADFGLTMADFEKMGSDPDYLPKPNG